MGKEIERKFLLVSESWKEDIRGSMHIRQGYLCGSSQCSVRVRLADELGTLSIKEACAGAVRGEFEYPIPQEDAKQLLDQYCGSSVVIKTRYQVPFKGHLWEIDVFGADNSGLVLAELELKSEGETFAPPPWLGLEVTAEQRYYNARLVRYPYREWPAAER